jgi:hypothetical protein
MGKGIERHNLTTNSEAMCDLPSHIITVLLISVMHISCFIITFSVAWALSGRALYSTVLALPTHIYNVFCQIVPTAATGALLCLQFERKLFSLCALNLPWSQTSSQCEYFYHSNTHLIKKLCKLFSENASCSRSTLILDLLIGCIE